MKVCDLIERLEECDPDADVLLMTQESWPFENDTVGVITREALLVECEDSDDAEYNGSDGEATDVFIVEGQQLRYGSKAAWTACY